MTDQLKSQIATQLKEKIHSEPDAVRKIDALDEEKVKNSKTDRKLKKKYALWFVRILVLQLLIMNAVFALVGLKVLEFNEWSLNLYMAGTLAEVFGIILVITSNLFPKQE